jgi:hypothetical protein
MASAIARASRCNHGHFLLVAESRTRFQRSLMLSPAHEKYRGRAAEPCRAAGCLRRHRPGLRSAASRLGFSEPGVPVGLAKGLVSEVFVFRHDAPATSNRKLSILSVVGIPQSTVATRYRFFADRRREPCQRWRHLGIDEEPHFIRLSDEDRMVEILGGVL